MNERTIDDILSDFADASVECEAVQLGMSRREQVIRADECRAELSERFAAARREVETVTRERDESRAALEDVRRVEAWLRGDASRSLQKSVGQFVARDDDYANPRSLYADSLESLGRALAQEAPPCRYCNGQGWDAVDGGNGEPIQVGCQFCNGTGTLAQEEGNAT